MTYQRPFSRPHRGTDVVHSSIRTHLLPSAGAPAGTARLDRVLTHLVIRRHGERVTLAFTAARLDVLPGALSARRA